MSKWTTLVVLTLAVIASAGLIGTASAAAVRVLCDGETYDGYADPLFKLDGGEAADGLVQKVIRNCTFKNSTVPPIVLRNAANVLIQGNTFTNIRTGIPGKGVHAINAACATRCADITVSGNSFSSIGADGIQVGDSGRDVTNLVIENNTFQGASGVGENAIDIKGANGPIVIRGNLIQGFRPCLSPKKGGTQDCSGSPGEGVVLHAGSAAGAPGNVTVAGNTFNDNVFGLSVSDTLPNVVVRNNQFTNNLQIGLLSKSPSDLLIANNTFDSNPTHIQIKKTTNCTLKGNTFTNGTPLKLKKASCQGGLP